MKVGRPDRFKTVSKSDNIIIMKRKMFCNFNDICVLCEIMKHKGFVLRVTHKSMLLFERVKDDN